MPASPRTRFQLDHDRLTAWINDNPQDIPNEPDWRPGCDDTDLAELIRLAQNDQVLLQPPYGLLHYVPADGEGYLWLVETFSPDPRRFLVHLRVASSWQSYVLDPTFNATGRHAVTGFLSEAVRAGNELLDRLEAWALAYAEARGVKGEQP